MIKVYKIYKLVCLITNKNYIGWTINFWRRLNQHIGSNYLIGKAIRKYELKNFKIEILWITTSKETANCIEKAAINFYNSKAPNGYNLTGGGDGRFCKQTKESIEKIKTSRKKQIPPFQNRKHTKEWKKDNSKRMQGNQYSKGVKHTKEANRKSSESQKSSKTQYKRIKRKIAKLEGDIRCS